MDFITTRENYIKIANKYGFKTSPSAYGGLDMVREGIMIGGCYSDYRKILTLWAKVRTERGGYRYLDDEELKKIGKINNALWQKDEQDFEKLIKALSELTPTPVTKRGVPKEETTKPIDPPSEFEGQAITELGDYLVNNLKIMQAKIGGIVTIDSKGDLKIAMNPNDIPWFVIEFTMADSMGYNASRCIITDGEKYYKIKRKWVAKPTGHWEYHKLNRNGGKWTLSKADQEFIKKLLKAKCNTL